MQYFYDAKIIHTFASQEESPLSVFFGNQIYTSIRQQKRIDETIKNKLLNIKRSISSPSFLVDEKWMLIRFMPTYILLKKLAFSHSIKEKVTLRFLNFLSRAISFTLRHIP